MNEYEDMVRQMSDMVVRVEELREKLINSSPLKDERDEYKDLVDKISFIMEELIEIEEKESF